jgi:hypothetical protein
LGFINFAFGPGVYIMPCVTPIMMMYNFCKTYNCFRDKSYRFTLEETFDILLAITKYIIPMITTVVHKFSSLPKVLVRERGRKETTEIDDNPKPPHPRYIPQEKKKQNIPVTSHFCVYNLLCNFVNYF